MKTNREDQQPLNRPRLNGNLPGFIFVLIFLVAMIQPAAALPQTEPVHDPISWQTLRPGLEFARIKAARYCRMGSPFIGAVRINSECFRFDIFSFKESSPDSPLTVEEWQEKTKALVVFNSGQYNRNERHIGLFYHRPRDFGMNLYAGWKALFVAEPDPLVRPLADLIDTEFTPYDPDQTPYRLAVQSMMLLDTGGKKRVRASDWVANRTILATDKNQRILVLSTEGGYTLWEMAEFLARSDLNIKHAMSLDGGFQAEMCVRLNGFKYTTYGSYSTQGEDNDHSIPGYHLALPAVVAVFDRPRGAQACR
ncbi:MAG: phosphodiester glycosidase family protein [Deltaproteobacteria bacterium]|nr:phosphodiester glycosidase family protein [Deltaproteobacteria bacterium]